MDLQFLVYELEKVGWILKDMEFQKKKELDAKKVGNVQRVARSYKCYATNNNLTTQSGNAKITWYFNSSTKKFVSNF